METSKEKAITELAYNKAHFIKFNEKLGKRYGFDVAVLIAIFAELEKYFERNRERNLFYQKSKGYFFCMAKYVTKRNGMSEKRVRRAVKLMEEEELIFTKKWKGNWKLYKINHKKLSQILVEISLNALEERGKEYIEIEDKLNEVDMMINTM